MTYGANPYGAAPYGADGGGSINYDNTLTDSVVATGSVAALLTAMLRDSVTGSTTATTQAAMHNALIDSAAGHTLMHVVFSEVVAESVAAATTLALTAGQIAAIVDGAVAAGLCTSTLAAKNALIEAVFVRDSLNRVWPASVSDAVAVAEAMQERLVTNVLLVDEALAQTTLAHTVGITIAVADEVAVADPLAHILAANELIEDSVLAVLTFELDGDVFTGVVLNTESLGVSEYTDFPFNSLCAFAGTYVGAASDGLYVLEGTDDAGEPIESFIRTGLLRIANGKKVRMPTAYFGYTSNGGLVLKVITTHDNGTKREDWYALEPRTAVAPRETRVKIGRGLSSVYWAYELHNISGSQFALDTIQLYPVQLERRI